MRLFIPFSLRLAIAAVAISLFASAPAFADTIAYEDPAFQGSQNFGGNLASTFSVNSAITVDQLGVFNALGTGVIAGPISVGIYDSAGTLLASATFSGSYTPAGLGYDVFQSITPIVLGPGSYVVDAVGFSNSDLDGNTTTGASHGPYLNSGGGALTFYGITYDYNTTLDDPGFCSSCAYPANTFDAGTFAFSSTPEPDSLVLLGTGLLGVVGLARRRIFAGR